MTATPPAIPDDTTGQSPDAKPEQMKDQATGRVFPCQGCGADLTFHIGVQSLKCEHCGAVKEMEFDPDAAVAEQDYQAMLLELADKRTSGSRSKQDLKEIRCGSCGANVLFKGAMVVGQCAYCGVPLQVEDAYDAPDLIPVDGVLPFQIDREGAHTELADWVRSRWFAPNNFKKHGIEGCFNGVYLPYWTFDSLTFNKYAGQRGEHYWVTTGSGKNRRRTRKTRWYPVSGSFQLFLDDILVPAALDLPTKRLNALEPWPLDRCLPFKEEILAGFFARTYEVPLVTGFSQAKDIMGSIIEDEIRRRIGGDTQRITYVSTRDDAVTFKHLLLPIWMLAYRYKEKTYQVVINAGTGEVQGDRPYSWIKILLTGLAAAAAIYVGWLCR